MAKKKKKPADNPGSFQVATNPKLTRAYEVVDKLECGIVLVGSEVKALRAKRCDLDGAFASVENMELYLHGMHVGTYEQAGRFGHDAKRKRKLLAHKREIERLHGRVSHKGYALVPARVYFKDGKAKVEIALGKGKKLHDDREAIKRKLDLREARAAMSSATKRRSG